VCIQQEIQTESEQMTIVDSDKTIDGLRQAVRSHFRLADTSIAGVVASLHGIDVALDEDSDVAQLQDGDVVVVRIALAPPQE
jgi:hypothetical protein